MPSPWSWPTPGSRIPGTPHAGRPPPAGGCCRPGRNSTDSARARRATIEPMPRFDPATVTELNRVGLLAELPGERLSQLAGRMERQDIEPGKPVVLEGEEGNHF